MDEANSEPRPMCRAPECRYFRLAEPGFTDRVMCSHPALNQESFTKEVEMPWTLNLDFGCNRHEQKTPHHSNERLT